MFEEACKNNKNIIGICRGSQLLTALNGGKLIQDNKSCLASGHNVRILDKIYHESYINTSSNDVSI